MRMRNRIEILMLLLLTLTFANAQSTQGYEYWLDDDYSNRTMVKGSETDVTLDIDVGNLRPGLHFFNFRAKGDDGIWGPLKCLLAYVPEDISPTVYEYWIDDDYANCQTTVTNGEPTVLTIDGSGLRIGLHYFNLRIKDGSGLWGPLNSYIINVEFKDMPIVGYQYAFDSLKVYVPVNECMELELKDLTLDIPDSLNVGSLEKDCTWQFDKNNNTTTLYRKNSLSFIIKFKNKANEWSIPEGDELEFPDTITKSMHHLQAGPQIKIPKVGKGSFAPISINISEARDYYLQTMQPCKMHLFDSNGKKLKTIDSDALQQGDKTAMNAGTYYAVVYNTQQDETYPSDSLNVLLALEAHTALTPTITHKKDTVYIVSEQPDVALYYTIDNTAPTTQSTRYTKPFNLTKNATVRAIAAGNGYAASAEAVSEIDPFKVEDVTFSADGYLLTMNTETEQSIIYYTTDGKAPTTASMKYETPVPLMGSCTVKAYAVRTGYTDSKVTSYVFDAGPVTALKPQLSHEGNVVSITTETANADIYYTTDGSTPTVESTKYTAPFHVTQNGTVKAVAKRTNYFDSPIGSLTVNWFKVDNVQFSADGYMLTMRTDTVNTIIYYTLDGTTPTAKSTRYEEPVALTAVCTVKAIAMRNNFTNSEVTQYQFVPTTVTVATPKVEHSGNTAIMSTTTESATIYYTLDGTTPSSESILYEKPFELIENGTVKAIAIRKNYFDSSVSSMTVDWFKVDTVAFSTNGYELSMTTATPDATIHFTTDGTTPTTASAKYSSPLALTSQCTVTAFAVKKNFNNSDITYFNFIPEVVTVAQPQIIHEGNVISISTATEGATVYYTTDGTEPTTASTRYANPFTVTYNCMILAIAVKDKYINSSIGKLEVDWFKVDDVQFESDGNVLTMKTTTEGATIYYTKDGTLPTTLSDKYVAPIRLTEKCTVRAIAVKEKCNNSDVTAFEFDPNNVTVSAPTVKRVGTSNFIELSTTTTGALLYYTTDGSTPSATNGELYTQAFEVTRNCMVKAIGVKENYNNSQVEELKVDWFRVDKVQYEANGYLLTMKVEPTDASIHYTTDGTDPTAESPVYSQPIELLESCIVKAFGIKDGYDDSEVSTFSFVSGAVTVAQPIIQHTGNVVFISTTTENTTVYYTTDGTTPSAENGIRYTTPFEVTQNCIIKAIGVKDCYFDSPIAELTVDWFRVPTPTFVLNGTMLSISCSEARAAIYYGIGDVEVTTLYTEPIVLTDNKPVKAIAILEGYQDSEVAIFDEKPITSLGVGDMAYDGHFVTITPQEAGAVVYYTTDGSDPTVDSDVYTEPIPLNKLCVVKATAMRPYTNMSEVKSKEIEFVYDGDQLAVKEAGLLAKSFEWCGAAAVKILHVSGPLNASDFATLRSLPNLQTLDLENAQPEGQMLAEGALQGATMRWFVSPVNIGSVGKNVFDDCRRLAAVTWQCYVPLKAELFGQHVNPNMLYYVKTETLVDIEGANTISNGHARSITLHDGETWHDFYCPTAFWTDEISYVRDFRQSTQRGICKGWETLALPFAVQTVTHWKNGELVPFAARQDNDERKPFWLAKLDERGFVNAENIEADVPYIISMPNDSAVYADRNLLAGEVTFAARNVQVVATDVDAHCGKMGEVCFIANYESQQPSASLYAINLYDAIDGYSEGSTFKPNYRVVRPFEAYTTSSAVNAPRYISIADMTGQTTGIIDIQADYGWMDKNAIKVYSLDGQLVKTTSYKDELKQLPKGIYIVNGRKVVVK